MNDDASSSDKTDIKHWERETLERLVTAQLDEQRAARRWRIGFRLFWMVVFLAAVWYSFHQNKSKQGDRYKKKCTHRCE